MLCSVLLLYNSVEAEDFWVCVNTDVSRPAASLRRNLRLKKDRHALPGEPKTPDAIQTEFLIYEEVTQYLPRPGDRPRLIVLIGTFNLGLTDAEVADLTVRIENTVCRTVWICFRQNMIALSSAFSVI